MKDNILQRAEAISSYLDDAFIRRCGWKVGKNPGWLQMDLVLIRTRNLDCVPVSAIVRWSVRNLKQQVSELVRFCPIFYYLSVEESEGIYFVMTCCLPTNLKYFNFPTYPTWCEIVSPDSSEGFEDAPSSGENSDCMVGRWAPWSICIETMA